MKGLKMLPKINFLKVINFIIIKMCTKVETINRCKKCNKDFETLKGIQNVILSRCSDGYKKKAKEMGVFNYSHIDCNHHSDICIGEIDQDGFVLSNVEYLDFAPTITPDKFMSRERLKIHLVIKDGYLAIKKDYCGHKLSFVNELKALYHLTMAHCNVPAILGVDFKNLTITMSFIQGKVLREELAQKGARIRDSQVGKNSEYGFFIRKSLIKKRVNEGRRFLHSVMDSSTKRELRKQLDEIHAAGIIVNDIKYGNIIIEDTTKEPYFIDFENSWTFVKPFRLKYKMLVHNDLSIFNMHFS